MFDYDSFIHVFNDFWSHSHLVIPSCPLPLLLIPVLFPTVPSSTLFMFSGWVHLVRLDHRSMGTFSSSDTAEENVLFSPYQTLAVYKWVPSVPPCSWQTTFKSQLLWAQECKRQPIPEVSAPQRCLPSSGPSISSVMFQEPRSSWYINAPFIAEHPTVPGALHLDQLLSLGGHGWICKQASLAEADSSRDLWAAGQVFRRQFDGYIIPIYQNHSSSFPTRVYELPHWANLWYLAWFPSCGMCLKLKQKTLATP